MFKKLSLLLCLCWFAAFAQKPAEISIISDNDLYTSTENDQYYTNGIEFIYRYLGNPRSDRVVKKITEFRFGQYMYNPQSPHVPEIYQQDRPFAGYLFLQAGISNFYNDQSLLRVAIQGGVVGPESLARQTQETLHKLFRYRNVEGWEHQITTTPAIQVNALYAGRIFPEALKENTETKWDIYLQGEAQLGTIWNSVSVGPMARISLKGPLKDISNSALYSATLNTERIYENRRELFVYLNPRLQYMAFDATIQGSPFNDKSPVTFELIPFRFNAEAGVRYGRNRWNYSFSFNYRSKELNNSVITGYYYGSIQLGYLL